MNRFASWLCGLLLLLGSVLPAVDPVELFEERLVKSDEGDSALEYVRRQESWHVYQTASGDGYWATGTRVTNQTTYSYDWIEEVWNISEWPTQFGPDYDGVSSSIASFSIPMSSMHLVWSGGAQVGINYPAPFEVGTLSTSRLGFSSATLTQGQPVETSLRIIGLSWAYDPYISSDGFHIVVSMSNGALVWDGVIPAMDVDIPLVIPSSADGRVWVDISAAGFSSLYGSMSAQLMLPDIRFTAVAEAEVVGDKVVELRTAAVRAGLDNSPEEPAPVSWGSVGTNALEAVPEDSGFGTAILRVMEYGDASFEAVATDWLGNAVTQSIAQPLPAPSSGSMSVEIRTLTEDEVRSGQALDPAAGTIIAAGTRVMVGTPVRFTVNYAADYGAGTRTAKYSRVDMAITGVHAGTPAEPAHTTGEGVAMFLLERTRRVGDDSFRFANAAGNVTSLPVTITWCLPDGEATPRVPEEEVQQCPLPVAQVTPLTSRVENPLLSHIHTATDYQSASGGGGCGPCGASVSAGGSLTTDLRLERIHRYADLARPGSFGPGIFSNLDIRLSLWNHGDSGELWDPSASLPVPLTPAGLGAYTDQKRSALVGVQLTAADGTSPAAADAAVLATATLHDGTQWIFELIQAGLGGDADRQGRLIAIRDRTGNQVSITYAFPASAAETLVGERARLLEMASAADQRGRRLTFVYGWTCGQPVITRVTYPTGAQVDYRYDGDIAGVSGITYPDGTRSTFALREDRAAQQMVVDYQDAGAEGTHRTKSVSLTLTSFTQAEGIAVGQSPNRVRRVVGPTGEPAYLNWLERDGAQVRIYAYEGGGIAGTGRMVRLDTIEGVTQATWVASAWTLGTPPATWTWEKVADYEPDARFRMAGRTDPAGKSTAYQRDAASGAITGRIHRNAAGSEVARESTRYNGFRQPTWHQDANGLITRTTYDDQGNMRFRTEGIVMAADGVTEDASQAQTWEWRYRTDGQVTQEIDPLGRVTEYEYDLRGFRTAEISPPDDPAKPLERAVKRWGFDAAGRLEWSEDARGNRTTYHYDLRNRHNETRYANGSKEVLEYGVGTQANLVVARTDRDGMKTTFGFDDAGREILHVEGAQVPATAITTQTWYLEGTDLPETVIRAGQKTMYVYDTQKRQVEVRRFSDATHYLAEKTVYDALDRVAYTEDPFGRRTYSVYDDLDRTVRTIREAVPGAVPADADLAALPRLNTENPAYVIEETVFDTGGRVERSIDGRGIATRMAYDRQNRMTDRWDAEGTADEAHWQWTYDEVGNRATETNPRGYVTEFAYTGRNLLASQTVAKDTDDEATTTFTYSLTGQRSSETDPRGHTRQWIYGGCCDWLDDEIDAEGYYTHFTYTLGGLTETVRDANLHTTRREYDGRKRTKTVTNADNEVTTWTYDEDLTDSVGLSGIYDTAFAVIADRTGHQAVAVANQLDETQVTVTDALGREVLRIDAEGRITRIAHDLLVTLADGTVLVETAVTDPTGAVVRQRSDGLGRVREMVDALGKVTRMGHDANGNRRRVTDPLGHGATADYDAQNRQVAATDAAGNNTGSRFDTMGNETERTDGRGKITYYTYTARNQKASETDRLGHTTTFSYDPAGNLLAISDADNEARKATVTPEVYEAGKTHYTYTERNQLWTETFPGPTGGTRTYTYKPNSLLWTRTDQRGIVTTFEYDGANRLTDRIYSDGTGDHFDLDDAGRILTATASRSGVVVGRTYYPTGLIKSETTTWPFGISGTSTSATVDYAYDAANRATTLTLPDGRILDRTFTARNELESLTIGGQAIATLGYDNAGRRTSALFGNGLTDTRTYTDNNLLKTTVVGPAAAPLLSLEYAYDANNRKTAETDHRDGSRSISPIGYDDNDRLTSWTTGGNPKLPTSRTWDLSGVGDWTKTTVDGVIEDREHTAVHEVKTRNATPVGYDLAGNLIRTADGQTFAWDAENRLLAADTAPNADGAKDKAIYQTDAFGRRVAKAVYGSTSLAIHDGWQVVQEISGPTVLPASAAADDGSLANLATVPAGAILPTTYDAQGNPQYPKRINFQPATTQIPQGYLADKSKDFAVRSNGLSYGWVAPEGTPSRGEPVIRHFMPLPQYDTFVPTGDPETWTWQIALPAGSYPVVLVLGDATNREHTFNVTVQGETFPDPHPYDPEENPGYEAGRFVGVSKQATVGEDGLLTIQAAAGALNGTLCWLEVGAEGTQLTEELRQKLADEVTHANARTGGSPFWDGGRSETKTFVWGPGIDELMGYQRTTAETGTTTLFVHSAAQWNVMAVTNSDGEIVERFQYTATGKRASDVAGANGRSISGLSTGWTGREHDEATGTIYFRYRIWDPEYQFLSRDPMTYVDGYSMYLGYFVPNAVDPDGLITKKEVQQIVDEGKKRGGVLAPAMLQHWLDGSGSIFVVNAEYLRASPNTLKAETAIQQLFIYRKPTNQESLLAKATKMGSDKSVVSPQKHVDYWEKLATYSNNFDDYYYALGDATLKGSGEFLLTRNGGNVDVKGTVYFTLIDKYNWDQGKKTWFPVVNRFVTDAEMKALETGGPKDPKPFHVRSYYMKTMTMSVCDGFVVRGTEKWDYRDIADVFTGP